MALIDTSLIQTFTAAQLLVLVEHRIALILVGAQSLSANGRQLTNADLGELYKQRDALKTEIDEAANGCGTENLLVQYSRD